MKKGVNPPDLSSSNKSLKIQKLENFIAKNHTHLLLKGLYGSSKSFFINQIFKNFDRNIFWILDNKEDAGYHYGDLENFFNEKKLYFLSLIHI